MAPTKRKSTNQQAATALVTNNGGSSSVLTNGHHNRDKDDAPPKHQESQESSSVSKQPLPTTSTESSSLVDDAHHHRFTTMFVAERVLMLGILLLTVGTLGFYYIPGMIVREDAPHRHHGIDAFYCASITLTTVGFGDICPGDDINLLGRIFLVLFSLCGLGIFCGPVMNLASSWRNHIPGGMAPLATCTLGMGVFIFGTLEGMDHTNAIYASVITGTTIGFGDRAPETNEGKIAVALYAIASVNVMAALLEPARQYLEAFCTQKVKVD